jgi:hypothetical protein
MNFFTGFPLTSITLFLSIFLNQGWCQKLWRLNVIVKLNFVKCNSLQCKSATKIQIREFRFWHPLQSIRYKIRKRQSKIIWILVFVFCTPTRNGLRPFLMTPPNTDTVFKFLVCAFCILYFFWVHPYDAADTAYTS